MTNLTNKIISTFFTLLIIGIIYVIFYYTGLLDDVPINPDGDSTYTGGIISNTGTELLSIDKNCSFTGTNYHSVDIFNEGNTFKTQAVKKLNQYTKSISIFGYIEEAYICVISDIRQDYRKFEAYKFSTYLYMGSDINAGNINTEYSLRNKVLYDRESGSSKDINGVFRGNEAPYNQVINLNNVTIASVQNGFSKEVSPIRLFNDGTTLRIGGYTNSYPNRRAGEITKLRIIYKGGNIELSK